MYHQTRSQCCWVTEECQESLSESQLNHFQFFLAYVATFCCHNVRPVLACGLFYWHFTITHVMWFLSEWKYNENLLCLWGKQFSVSLIEVVWLKKRSLLVKSHWVFGSAWLASDPLQLVERWESNIPASVSPSLAIFLELKDKFGPGSFLWKFYLSCIRVKKITSCLYLSVGQGQWGVGAGVGGLHSS